MIRRKEPDRRLFYSDDEIHRPPRSNVYIRLNKAVGSWEDLCAPLRKSFCQEKNGRPVDPTVYFKIFLVGYLENITFDTDLAERIADSLSIREFLGYAPHERTPDHSRISAARNAFSRGEQLQQVMDSVLSKCAKAGLIGGTEVAVDSTLVLANASLGSMKHVDTGQTVREHFKDLRASGKPLKVSNVEFRSTTDPDGRIAKKRQAQPRDIYHKITHVTDSVSQVILAAEWDPADVGDSDAALAPLKKAQARLTSSDLSLGTVLGDKGYDDSKFHHAVEEMKASPLTSVHSEGSPKEKGFKKSDFQWDAIEKTYICPAGKHLTKNGGNDTTLNFRSTVTDCDACPFRGKCLSPDKRQRTVHRAAHEEARDRNKERAQTQNGKALLKKRGCIVEPPFGDMKRNVA